MDLEIAYFMGFVITSLSTMVAVFVYEYTIKGDMLNGVWLPMVLVSLAISMCWFMVTPIATTSWASLRSGKTFNILS